MGDQNDLPPLRDVVGAIQELWNSPTPEPVGEILGSKDSEDYPMNYEKIGICYIFNNKTFKPSIKLDERSGTDVDANQLDQLFSKLGFEVFRFNDYTEKQILFTLQEVSRKDFKNYSCFVCCILSYGTDEGKLCARDGDYPIQRIYERFYADKCTSLAGKPKLFFIQACPCRVKKSSQQSTDYGRQVSFTIPTNADFLVAYSTVPGFYSWENSNNGSWFTDALCSSISKYIGNMDMLQLLSLVNHKVAAKYNNYESKKLIVEVPCVTSTLTRDIKFPMVHSLESKMLEGDGDSDFACETGRMSNSKIGKVLIFNHKVYENDRKDKHSRDGSECDAENLQRIFKKLNFNVDLFTDKRKDFILRMLRSVANEPHEKYSCFICCILSHGDYGTLSAYDGSYQIDDVFSAFYDNWVGKPKIFFIQACQGKKLDCGIKMVDNQRQSTDSKRTFNFRHITHPDFLIVSSSAPGYFSFRNPTTGSWFVQELYKAFNEHAKDKSFLQLLTITNRQVAIECLSNNPKKKEHHEKKQTLCLTSTLTQNIDFEYLKQNN